MLTKIGTSMNISWTAVTGTGSKYAIGYVVRYSTKSSTTTDPPSDAMMRSGIIDTSTTLTGLQSGTTYYVWVAAEVIGAGVQGPYSVRVSSGGEIIKLFCWICTYVALIVIIYNSNYIYPQKEGNLRSEANLKALISSLNSGYCPCSLMSLEEHNELMGGTKVCWIGSGVSNFHHMSY